MPGSDLFITFIYQPFLNVLVFIYWLLGLVMSEPDMGIAVILLTIFIRVLLLPLSLAGEKSESERRVIAATIKKIERDFADDPIMRKRLTKEVMRERGTVIAAEIFNLFIQVMIALMLWKMFGTGLSGEDLHLIYPFMPDVATPFNLVFWGTYDLTHGSFVLNIIQSVLIFAVETLSLYTSPFPVTRKEVVRLQLTLPVISFIIFSQLPAGKKLFVITTLIFSLVLMIIRALYRKFRSYKEENTGDEAPPSGDLSLPPEEKILVKQH